MKLLLPLSLALMSNLLLAKANCNDPENVDRKNIESCLEQSDKALNKVYKNLIRSHKGQSKPQDLLKKAQRAWIITRDAHCTMIGQATVVSAGVNMAVCEMKMTQNRTKELQELFEMGISEPEVLHITKNSFDGIKIGSKIASHKNLKKNILKTGEGDFESYIIQDANAQELGYLLPDPKNSKLVGDIVITTENASTQKGSTYVGITFKTLKEIFPKIEVHGSEIEGRTHASANGIMYRLNVENVDYNINIKKVPNTAKVIEILLQHK